MVKTAFDMYPQQFLWKEPPYEYVFDKNPFDVICGTDATRKAIEDGRSLTEIIDSWQKPLDDFKMTREKFLLY